MGRIQKLTVFIPDTSPGSYLLGCLADCILEFVFRVIEFILRIRKFGQRPGRVAQTSADSTKKFSQSSFLGSFRFFLELLRLKGLTLFVLHTFTILLVELPSFIMTASKKKLNFSIRSRRSSKKRDHSPPLSTFDHLKNMLALRFFLCFLENYC